MRRHLGTHEIVKHQVGVARMRRAFGNHKAVDAVAKPLLGVDDGQRLKPGGLAVVLRHAHKGGEHETDGRLAGSTLTMIRAFQNLMRFGATPENAAAMTTKTPAMSIGNEDMGEIELGAPAIFARFNAAYEFVETIG